MEEEEEEMVIVVGEVECKAVDGWLLRFCTRLPVLTFRGTGIAFGALDADAEDDIWGRLRRSAGLRPGSNWNGAAGDRGLALAGGLTEADWRDGE